MSDERSISSMLVKADEILETNGGRIKDVSHKEIKEITNAIFSRLRQISHYKTLHHTVMEQRFATVWSFEAFERVIRKWILQVFAGKEYLEGKVVKNIVLWLKTDVEKNVVFKISLETNNTNFELPTSGKYKIFSLENLTLEILKNLRILRKEGTLKPVESVKK